MSDLTLNEIEAGVLQKDVKRAAKSVAFQWPDVIEADDVEQEIWLHILERPGTRVDLLEMDELPRYRTISKIGHRIASKARTDSYYSRGVYLYSLADVKRMLNSGAIKEFQLKAQSYDGDQISVNQVGPDSQVSDEVMDLRRALVRLSEKNERYAVAIINRYRLDQFPSNKSDTDALNHGIESLTNEINRIGRTAEDEQHI